MLRYVYSALLLAVAKPACDYVIRLINKNTDARIGDATAEILNQLKRRFEELQKELVSENNNGEAQIAEARRLIAACSDEISRSRKRLSPVKVRDASEIRKIQQDIADVRRRKDRGVDEEALGSVRRLGRARAAPHTTGIKRHVGRGMIMLY